MTPPWEMRALGLTMRVLEQRGVAESTPDLRVIVEASGFSPEEIDRAFELLVTTDGFTVGGQAELAELDGFRVGALVLVGMIEIDDGGQWILSDRGAALSDLLSEYSRPKRKWRRCGDHGSLADVFEPGQSRDEADEPSRP